MAAELVYRSKTDRWLVVTMGVAAVGAVAACAPVIAYGDRTAWLVVVPTLLLGIGLPAWIMKTTSYTIAADSLVIRSGPFRWNVPLGQITAIRPTTSPLSSPALSLDRLRIDYGKGSSIMISPEDRERFLHNLRARHVTVA